MNYEESTRSSIGEVGRVKEDKGTGAGVKTQWEAWGSSEVKVGVDYALSGEEFKSVTAIYRCGSKFLVEVPEDYTGGFHTQSDGTYIMATKDMGLIPILYLHQERETFTWKDYMPLKPIKCLVEEEKIK